MEELSDKGGPTGRGPTVPRVVYGAYATQRPIRIQRPAPIRAYATQRPIWIYFLFVTTYFSLDAYFTKRKNHVILMNGIDLQDVIYLR